MGREVRRVPVGWEPPKRPCTYSYWPEGGRCPNGGWHYKSQYDESYTEALAKWEQGKAEWEAGTHKSLAFLSVYHRRGGGEWHGQHLEGIPQHIYADDCDTVIGEVWFESVEQYVRDVPWEDAGEGGSRPIDNGDYHPDWPEGTPLGYCLYETVSEGTPLSPVFATADELAVWMSENEIWGARYALGQARAFVAEGWAPSFVAAGGKFQDGVTWVAGVEATP